MTEGADFEFLDTLNRSSHHTGSHAVGLAACETGEVLNVSDSVAGHIIRVITTIYGESVLVHIAAGDIASRRHTWLQRQQRGGITPQVRQQLKILQVDGVANRCIRCLKFRARLGRNHHGLAEGADLQCDIKC